MNTVVDGADPFCHDLFSNQRAYARIADVEFTWSFLLRFIQSCVTFFACFPEKQNARRSRVTFFAYFPEKQNARRSHVTFFAYFPEK